MKQPRKIAYIILLFVVALMVATSLTSCKSVEEWHCRKCPTHDSTTTSKDISEKTVILFDTIEVPYPVQGPIQYLENPCKNLCDSLGRLKPFEIKKKTNGITGTIKSVGNSIVFDCKEDSLKYIIEKQITTIKDLETKTSLKTVQKPCELEHTNKFTGFTFWWFWITFVLLLLIILWKCFKTYLKAYLPFLK